MNEPPGASMILRVVISVTWLLAGLYVSIYLVLGSAVIGIIEAAKTDPTDTNAVRLSVAVIVIAVPLCLLVTWVITAALWSWLDPGKPRRHRGGSSRQVELGWEEMQRNAAHAAQDLS